MSELARESKLWFYNLFKLFFLSQFSSESLNDSFKGGESPTLRLRSDSPLLSSRRREISDSSNASENEMGEITTKMFFFI